MWGENAQGKLQKTLQGIPLDEPEDVCEYGSLACFDHCSLLIRKWTSIVAYLISDLIIKQLSEDQCLLQTNN